MPDLRPYIIYSCVVGSRAYGLDTEASDTDRRGFFLPPASLHWALESIPEQIVDEKAQECFWELEKFIRLALKCNPNALECLYTPLVERATPLAQELLGLRRHFLSRMAYPAFLGYSDAQFLKLKAGAEKGTVNWRHAMHLLRLLYEGIVLVREGRVDVDMSEHREILLSVKRGEVPWEEVEKRRQLLQEEFRRAQNATPLPQEPNVAPINYFLIRARRSVVDL